MAASSMELAYTVAAAQDQRSKFNGMKIVSKWWVVQQTMFDCQRVAIYHNLPYGMWMDMTHTRIAISWATRLTWLTYWYFLQLGFSIYLVWSSQYMPVDQYVWEGLKTHIRRNLEPRLYNDPPLSAMNLVLPSNTPFFNLFHGFSVVTEWSQTDPVKRS